MKQSAGILAFRYRDGELEVLLAHPGGPLWANKDDGAWSIPKGEFDDSEVGLDAARREFQEETSIEPPSDGYISLGSITQKSGKLVHAWAVEMDLDPAQAVSNNFALEWPPRSGKTIEVPEVDQVEWFRPPDAHRKANPAQAELISRLVALRTDR